MTMGSTTCVSEIAPTVYDVRYLECKMKGDVGLSDMQLALRNARMASHDLFYDGKLLDRYSMQDRGWQGL